VRLFIRTHHPPPSPPSLAVPHVLTCTSTAHEECGSSTSSGRSVRASTVDLAPATTYRTTTTTSTIQPPPNTPLQPHLPAPTPCPTTPYNTTALGIRGQRPGSSPGRQGQSSPLRPT